MAGSVASERQLTGVFKSDERFPAMNPAGRLSSLDPNRNFEVANWAP
jgi:hypothetical protein